MKEKEGRVPSHAIVLGGTLAGARAARRLAEAGLTVTLLQPTPFLGGQVPQENVAWMPAVPALLEAIRNPGVTVLSRAIVESIAHDERGFHLQVQQMPRYVDPVRCTGCAECEKVCPVGAEPGNGTSRRAIYRDPAGRAVPNVFAIEKKGEAPCTHTCPGGIHVQGYVALVAQGKFQEAHDLITQEIPLPGICGRVCYHPCEAQCNRYELDKPVAVRALKRFVADRVKGGPHWPPVEPDPTLPPVAVVGSGPAGLAAAWMLVRQGVRVTVLEALPVAGGMLAVGIPTYRLPRETLRREIAAIEALGVEIRLNTPLGPGLTVDDLFAQGYGAVFLALGAHRSRKLGVPGEETPGVAQAIDLLRQVCLAQEKGPAGDLKVELKALGLETGQLPVVVGGGNSAIDVARTLLRLGAERVRILYRRSRQEMPASPEEVAAAEHEGVVLETLVAPVRVIEKDGRVGAIECRRMELGEPDESGRRQPVPIPGSEFLVETDMIVSAVGQEPDLACLPGDLCDKRGRICADAASGETSRPGVFAAGDVIQPASVIEAIGAGKKAAAAILRYLRGEPAPRPEPERPVVRLSVHELEEHEHQSRQEPAELNPRRRRQDFREVEKAFTAEQAVAEARRCLACAVCSECLQCVTVCEAKAIDHQAQPRYLALEADVVVQAGEYTLPPVDGAWQIGEAEPEAAIEALLAAVPQERTRRPLMSGHVPAVVPPLSRVGIFLCRCGDQIASSLDLDALQARAATLPNVVKVEQVPFACLPEGIAALRQATAGLDGAVLAACSCCNLAHVCYSCTSQRVRCRSGLGVWDEGEAGAPAGQLPSWSWEYVNLREHCAWVRTPADGLEAAGDMLAAAAARLAVGPAVPLIATVDPARCRTCGTCETLCQAGTIRLERDEQGHVFTSVEESRCLTCGTCAAHCPTGALSAGRVSDRQVEATVQALVGGGKDHRVLVFTCNWGGHSGAEAAGMMRLKLPAGVRVIRLPCLGRLSPGLLLRALEMGVAGVLLLGCPEDGCDYDFGKDLAAEAVVQAQALTRLVGLGTERLGLASVGLGDGKSFVEYISRFAKQVGAKD